MRGQWLMDVCVSVSVCLTILYVCVICTLLCRHTCGTQNGMSGTSFHHSQLYCNLLLKPEILFRLLGHWYFKISLSFPQNLRLQHAQPYLTFYVDDEDLNLSIHVGAALTLIQLASWSSPNISLMWKFWRVQNFS